jgi:N6-adenosine-specific RNA methylase IME4
MLREGAPHELLRAWGLRWVGEILWDKGALGTGHFVRSRTEVLILALRGSLPLLSDRVDPLLRAKRRAHSEKPEEFARLISELSPGPRIELFARRARPGWDRWGLEA